MKNDTDSTIIQTILPQCDDLLPALKERKETMHVTNQDIADATGLPYDFVRKYFSGQQKSPSVYNIVAICIYLDLSLDNHFHHSTQTSNDPGADAKIAALKAEIQVLEEKLKDKDFTIARLEGGIRKRKPLIYALLLLCLVMAVSLSAYVGIDLFDPSIGFIRDGKISPIGFIVAIAIIFAVTVSATAIIRAVKKK